MRSRRGEESLELTVECSKGDRDPRKPLGRKKTTKSLGWMSGSSEVVMSGSIVVSHLGKERRLWIIHYLDGLEVSRALFFLGHQDGSSAPPNRHA